MPSNRKTKIYLGATVTQKGLVFLRNQYGNKPTELVIPFPQTHKYTPKDIMSQLVQFNEAIGQAITTSLHVAKVFEKTHEHVLRDIRELHCSDEFRQSNFGLLVEMKPLPQGGASKKEYYQMTKDGFSFLAIGYTGAKAGQFKEDFLKAFNLYEGLLKDEDYIVSRALSIV